MKEAERDRYIKETHHATVKMARQVDRNTINIGWLRWLLLASIGVFGAIIKLLHFK